MVEQALVCVEERRVGGLWVSARKESLSIRHSFSEPLARGFSDMAPEDRIDALREIFKKHEFNPGRATLVVPRAGALVRELVLPQADPLEIPGMIRFQLSRDLPVAIEEVRYATIERPGEGSQARLWATVVAEATLKSSIDALQGAGVRVGSAHVSTFGLLALLPESKEPVAIAVVGDRSAEILVGVDRRILMTSSVSVAGMSPQEVRDQVQRAILSYLSQSPGRRIARLLVAGAPAEISGLGVAVEPLDVAAICEGKTLPPELVPLAGSALSMARNGGPPELKKPPGPRKKFELRTPLRVAGLLAVIGILALVYMYVRASDAETERQRIERELQLKQKDLKYVRSLRSDRRLAEEWASGRPLWVETLLELSRTMDTHKVYLTNATFEDDGEITLAGRASGRESVTDLIQKLEETPGLRDVNPVNTTQAGGSDRKQVPFDFTIKARVQP
jgi:Tfp pilus assembly protein PilN